MKKTSLLLTACMVAVLGAGCIAFSACSQTHDHIWDEGVTTKRATCSVEGTKVYHCTVSGCTETKTESIPTIDHTRGETGKDTATCEAGGHMIYTCVNCGAEFEGEATTPLGHNMLPDKDIVPATCLAGGTKQWKCSRCDKTEERSTEQLEHDYQLDEDKSKPATCTEEGLEVYTCVNGCGDSREESIAPLQHQIGDVTRVDPSFEQDGYIRGHCTRCNQDIDEILPMLHDGDEVDFTFRFTKDGNAFFYDSMTMEITDETGKVVATGKSSDIIGGKYVVKLPIHPTTTYTITTDHTSCYRAEPLTVTPANPEGTVLFRSYLFKADDPSAPKSFKTGMMMQDFIFTDIDGNEVHLDTVLKRNKIVMLDIFYSGCQFCQQELEDGLDNTYQKYKDKGLEIIGISDSANDPSEDNVRAFREQYGVTYPLVWQQETVASNFIFYKFDFSGAPAAVFIDHDGYIRLTVEGYHPQSNFEKWFKDYTDKEFDDLETESNTVVASVPVNENDGLKVAFERGEYFSGKEN